MMRLVAGYLCLLVGLSGCYGDQIAELREEVDRLRDLQTRQGGYLRDQIRLTNQRAFCDEEARAFLAGCPSLTSSGPVSCPDQTRFHILQAIGRQRHEVLYFLPPDRVDQIPSARLARLRRLVSGKLPFTTQFLVLAQPLPNVYNSKSEAESRGRSFVNSVLRKLMEVPADAIVGPKAFPFCVEKKEILQNASKEDLPGVGEPSQRELGIWVFRVDC